MVVRIGDVHRPIAGHLHVIGPVEPGRGRRPAIAAEAAVTRASRECTDGRGGRTDIDFADPVVEITGNVHVAVAVDCHVIGPVEPGRGRRPAVAAEPTRPRSRDRADGRRVRTDIDLPHTIIPRIGDVYVAVAVNRHATGLIQPGRRRRPAVAAEARAPSPCDRGDGRGIGAAIDLQDAVVLGNVHIVGAVHRQATGA